MNQYQVIKRKLSGCMENRITYTLMHSCRQVKWNVKKRNTTTPSEKDDIVG